MTCTCVTSLRPQEQSALYDIVILTKLENVPQRTQGAKFLTLYEDEFEDDPGLQEVIRSPCGTHNQLQ